MAYQIGFDLYESATQDLLSHVRQGLRTTAPVPALLKDVDALTITTSSTSVAPAEGTNSGNTEEEEKTVATGAEDEGDAPMSEEKTLDDLVFTFLNTSIRGNHIDLVSQGNPSLDKQFSKTSFFSWSFPFFYFHIDSSPRLCFLTPFQTLDCLATISFSFYCAFC